MRTIFLILINIALLCVIFITGFYLFTQEIGIFAKSNDYNINKSLNVDITEKIKEIKREKPPEKEIRGLYLTAYSANMPERMERFIELINDSDLNAVVIDIKDYSGVIAYDSKIEIVDQLGNDSNLIKNLPDLIEKFHQNNIYVIARQTVFQDPELTSKKPEWAVKNTGTGGIWHDWKGLAWVDPTNQNVWHYNLAIAKEAISLGFDEINFDYIRFPSDGPMQQMGFKNLKGRAKHEVMKDFFAFLYENLKDEPAYISADLFGFTTEREDDMNIGQQIEDAAIYFDYVCPMVYPSHYPSGHLDLANPAAHPYKVVSQAMKKGTESLTSPQPKTIINEETGEKTIIEPENPIEYRAKIRPWLQAFHMGAQYTPTMIESQIQASNKNGGYGYLLWNARNVYDYLP